MSVKPVIHLIPNAHLDPVWLWDWREGFTEMIATTRTILDLMDEFPELTFVRGEAMLYRHIEQVDPGTFSRVLAYIGAGRWDVVGGMMVQADMNMPATETCIRHLLQAQRYFQDHLGVTARVGWAADCFGHSVAVPDLLAAGGLTAYSYSRPTQIPPPTTFWWEGPAGGRLLVHRPGEYCSERHGMADRLDKMLGRLASEPCRNIVCYMGLGNHGGHPTRRMLAESRAWAQAHPQVEVRFSTLTRFFEILRAEAGALPEDAVPVFRGEVNFAPRGIFAAAARFKFAYRKAEAALGRAERFASVVTAAGETADTGRPALLAGDLREAWDAVLLNSFHDIMPGSSIERACDEQADWLALAPHAARTVEQRAVYELARRIDTRVRPPAPDRPSGLPMLVFNPHPWPYRGAVELEACPDFRPLWTYRDKPDQVPLTVLDPEAGALPLQKIDTEGCYGARLNIRCRVVVPVEVPAMGWKVLEFAYEEGAPSVPVPDPVVAGATSLSNGMWDVSATPGDAGIRVRRTGMPMLDEPGLSALTVEDPWGIWGDFNDSPESRSLERVRETWRVTRVEVGERGPLRATLLVRMEAGHSRLDLTLALGRGRDVLDVRARVFWDERCARLKLKLPGTYTRAEYDVMGGRVERGPLGEVPGGRWVRMTGRGGALAFASDALYGFNLTSAGDMQVTVVRATRYTDDQPAQPQEHPWRAVLDAGELRFGFLLTADLAALPRLAAELEEPPLVAHVVAAPGAGPKTGGLLSLTPDSVRLLAMKPAEDGGGWVLRLQSFADQVVAPQVTWMGQILSLAPLSPRALGTWLLRRSEAGGWNAVPTDLTERRIQKWCLTMNYGKGSAQ